MNEVEAPKNYSLIGKWGSTSSQAGNGFQMVPDRLFRHQRELGIDNTSMVVLLNILMHWWDVENLPHPGTNVIAQRMGVSKRTVERSLKQLQKKGIIVRLPRELDGRGQSIRKIDPTKLVRKLKKYAV